MYHIEVKHDTRDQEWKRLGVTRQVPFSAVGLLMYQGQYAIDNQMNVDCVAVRMIGPDGIVVERQSNASLNQS